jgi:hypothetical protein
VALPWRTAAAWRRRSAGAAPCQYCGTLVGEVRSVPWRLRPWLEQQGKEDGVGAMGQGDVAACRRRVRRGDKGEDAPACCARSSDNDASGTHGRRRGTAGHGSRGGHSARARRAWRLAGARGRLPLGTGAQNNLVKACLTKANSKILTETPKSPNTKVVKHVTLYNFLKG